MYKLTFFIAILFICVGCSSYGSHSHYIISQEEREGETVKQEELEAR